MKSNTPSDPRFRSRLLMALGSGGCQLLSTARVIVASIAPRKRETCGAIVSYGSVIE